MIVVVDNNKLTKNEEDVIELLDDAYTIAKTHAKEDISDKVVDSITFRASSVTIALKDK